MIFADVSVVASHARSILKVTYSFDTWPDAPDDLDIQRAYVQEIHLYDCTKRISILPHILPEHEIEGLRAIADEIRARLEGIDYFTKLDPKLKKELLAGRWLMITPQRQLIDDLNIKHAEFDFFWNYLSQYTHVLSFTFHRIEPNGRGTGLENQLDRDALCMVLAFCTGLLVSAVDRLVELFPDAAEARKGLNVKVLSRALKESPLVK